MSMIAILAALAIIVALATIYFAVKSVDFRKFLAGAFFVSAGVQLYLYIAGVSVPLIGTDLILTPEISALRAIPHAILFLVCLYFGFIKEPNASTKTESASGTKP
jgi:hypothetical protein